MVKIRTKTGVVMNPGTEMLSVVFSAMVWLLVSFVC